MEQLLSNISTAIAAAYVKIRAAKSELLSEDDAKAVSLLTEALHRLAIANDADERALDRLGSLNEKLS